jgi:hypothetical protein
MQSVLAGLGGGIRIVMINDRSMDGLQRSESGGAVHTDVRTRGPRTDFCGDVYSRFWVRPEGCKNQVRGQCELINPAPPGWTTSSLMFGLTVQMAVLSETFSDTRSCLCGSD